MRVPRVVEELEDVAVGEAHLGVPALRPAGRISSSLIARNGSRSRMARFSGRSRALVSRKSALT